MTFPSAGESVAPQQMTAAITEVGLQIFHLRLWRACFFHKVPGAREAIKAVGASIMYLPAFSPDLNPIEQVSPG